MIVSPLAAAALLLFVCLCAPAAAGSYRAAVSEVTPENGRFVFDAQEFEDGKARHYVYETSRGDVRFFLVESDDGMIRAAFDACDVCWRHKKGYVQEGDMMTCVNCSLKFPTSRINIARGGCNPAPLTRRLQGDKVVIEADDVMSGLRYFR
jgi:uncharacterized membrane protein